MTYLYTSRCDWLTSLSSTRQKKMCTQQQQPHPIVDGLGRVATGDEWRRYRYVSKATLLIGWLLLLLLFMFALLSWFLPCRLRDYMCVAAYVQSRSVVDQISGLSSSAFVYGPLSLIARVPVHRDCLPGIAVGQASVAGVFRGLVQWIGCDLSPYLVVKYENCELHNLDLSLPGTYTYMCSALSCVCWLLFCFLYPFHSHTCSFVVLFVVRHFR